MLLRVEIDTLAHRLTSALQSKDDTTLCIATLRCWSLIWRKVMFLYRTSACDILQRLQIAVSTLIPRFYHSTNGLCIHGRRWQLYSICKITVSQNFLEFLFWSRITWNKPGIRNQEHIVAFSSSFFLGVGQIRIFFGGRDLIILHVKDLWLDLIMYLFYTEGRRQPEWKTHTGLKP